MNKIDDILSKIGRETIGEVVTDGTKKFTGNAVADIQRRSDITDKVGVRYNEDTESIEVIYDPSARDGYVSKIVQVYGYDETGDIPNTQYRIANI